MPAMLHHAWVLRWMRRRHPRVAGPISVERNRIYILPTRQGWGFALLLGTMLLAALNYGNSLMFVVCFWMGGVAFLTMHHTHRNLLGLQIVGRSAAPVFAGSEAIFLLRASHTDAAPRYGLRLHHVDEARALGLTVPVVPGIMPITSSTQLMRFSDACGAEIPRWIRLRLQGFGDDTASIKAFGLDVVTHLCDQLRSAGAPGLHFYSMNQSVPSLAVLDRLGL